MCYGCMNAGCLQVKNLDQHPRLRCLTPHMATTVLDQDVVVEDMEGDTAVSAKFREHSDYNLWGIF